MKKGLITIIATIFGAAAGAGITAKHTGKKIRSEKTYGDKHLALYLMMNQWVKIKQENKSIAEYLEKNDYKEIAIYGMNYVGETLLSELAESSIKVKYAIDKNVANIYTDVDVISTDDVFEQVDAIIVTPITFFNEIEELLENKVDCPILSIEDILYEVQFIV